jgi:hypothetical protein
MEVCNSGFTNLSRGTISRALAAGGRPAKHCSTADCSANFLCFCNPPPPSNVNMFHPTDISIEQPGRDGVYVR